MMHSIHSLHKCHDHIVCVKASKIDDALPRRACLRYVTLNPRAEREAKPPADDSGARSGRQVGGHRSGEGVWAVYGARSRRCLRRVWVMRVMRVMRVRRVRMMRVMRMMRMVTMQKELTAFVMLA